MSAGQLLTISMLPFIRSIRRWWLRRQLAHIGYTLKHIQLQRENDRHAERILMGKQAVLQSDLRNT
jgi:hypothetical protein